MLSLFKRVIALLVAFIMSAIFFAVPPANAETGVSITFESVCGDGVVATIHMPTITQIRFTIDQGPYGIQNGSNTSPPGVNVGVLKSGMYFGASMTISTSDSVDEVGEPVWTEWGTHFFESTQCPMVAPAQILKWGKTSSAPRTPFGVVRTRGYWTALGWTRCGTGEKLKYVGSVSIAASPGRYRFKLPRPKPGTKVAYCLFSWNTDWSGTKSELVQIGKKQFWG